MSVDCNSNSSKVNTLFQQNLPTYPYATNDFQQGLYRHRKENASKYKYIQFNHSNSLRLLTVDIDHDVYYEDLDPAPNLIVMNKGNSKCHAMYLIKPSVHLNEFSARKPIVFAENVLDGLTARLNGDKNFSHLISKNPLNESFRIFTPRLEEYDLTELAEWIPDKILKQEPKKETAYGRNCQVFDWCREWAYLAIREYINRSPDEFHSSVLARCIELNTRVYLPMTLREVKTIAKSIAKWVWKERFNLTSFSKQRARAKRLGVIRRDAMATKQVEAIKLLGQGLTITQIAKTLKVTERSVWRYLDI